MATQKVSAMTALTGANLATGDLVEITDVSASASKKSTAAEFLLGLNRLDTNDVFLVCFGVSDAVTVNDNAIHYWIPSVMNGKSLTTVIAYVTTASSSGLPTVSVRNVTTGHDMLSTACTIDANELNSTTAATPAVVNASFKAVSTNDEISIDVDTAGTGTTGLAVRLQFA